MGFGFFYRKCLRERKTVGVFRKMTHFIQKCVTKLQNAKNEDSVSVLSRPGADKQAYRVLVMLKKKLLIDLACMRSHLFI